MIGVITAGLTFMQPPAVKPVVTGGTLTSDATYYYRTFTSGGTLGVSAADLTCDVLVVGGGGGGCVGTSGSAYGGGAAGAIVNEQFSKTAPIGSNTVTVGSGGAGSGTSGVSGSSGTSSSIVLSSTYTATAGGGGQANGSGGTNASYSGGGNAGGGAGGGAGAGGNGGAGSSGGNGTGGTGGSGVSSTILGYRLAGGATGSANGTMPAAVDGGGRGSTDSPNYAGAAPTQYGGGGASVATSGFRTGFAGVVVVRYTKAQVD